MFGYVRVREDELKLKDYALYRGVYCGLCKTMKKYTGLSSTFTLSYDFVLLALLRSGLTEEGFQVRPGKCAAHPIKKRPIAVSNSSLCYTASVASVLAYYKLLDDKDDRDKKFSSLLSPAIAMARRNMKKALKAFPDWNLDDLAGKIREHLVKLSESENSAESSADMCADIFGKLLRDVFINCAENSEYSSACADIGYHTGRWIYLIDLCDDFEKDKKKGSFNPLLKSGFDESPGDLLRASLFRESAEALHSFSQIHMKYRDISNIIDNIFRFGLPNVTEKILKIDPAVLPEHQN